MIADAFRPNQPLSARAWSALLAIETAALLVGWALGDSLSIPGPIDTVLALGRLVRDDGLIYETWVSLKVNVEAIALSTMISVGLAYLTVLPAAQPPSGLLALARFSSLSGLVTVFTLAFGGGHGLKVALLTFGVSVFFVTAMISVVASVPKADWDQTRTLRMRGWRAVREVVVLGKADETLDTLRQNAAISWMMLTMVEGLVRSEGGIGAALLSQAKYRHWDAVFAIMLLVLALGMAQDKLLESLKGFLCPYAKLTKERQ